jgi:hypothetical protein
MVGADLNVTYSIIWSLALANIMGAGICILLARPISRLTTIPFPLLAPPMIALICFAAFQATRDLSDLVALLTIGLLGILMKRFGWPRPALLIGYVLAPQAETFFYQALQCNGWAFLIRPGVLIIAALTLASIYFGLRNRVDDTGPTSEAAVTSHASRNIQIAFAVAMMAFFGVALWDSAAHSFLGAVFPLGVGVVGAVFGVILLLHLGRGHQDHPAFFDYEIVGDHVGNEGAGWFWTGFIKKFRAQPSFVLPDRATVGMDRRFLRSYSQLLVRTCHRRGAHAMGGMAAQIPIRDDEEKNRAALDKVRVDKEREARAGHDGTWVAHPALIPIARAAFDAEMPGANQLERAGEDLIVSADDLLSVPGGRITEAGLRQNLNVGVSYLEAWLRGVGCVPLYGLMEDAATAEISRTQIWQWLRYGARLDDGRRLTEELVRRTLSEELVTIRADIGDERYEGGRFQQAAELFERLITQEELEEFLTLAAYAAL